MICRFLCYNLIAMADEVYLSDREKEILKMVATGASNKEIAQRLVISPNTVKVHLRNIFTKIEVTSRTEATLYAIRHGIIASPGQAPAAVADAAQADSLRAGDLEGGAPLEGTAPQDDRPDGASAVGKLAGTDELDKKKESKRRRWAAAAALVLLLVLGVVAASTLLAGQGLGGRVTHPPEETRTLTPAPESRWKIQAPLPEARSGLAATVYDGKIYAIGGQAGTGISGAMTRFDPEKNTWQTLSPLPEPVTDIQAALVGGKIYVPGGQTASGVQTDLLQVYDPRRDTWEQKAHLPVAVSGYALAVFEGKLYIFGGWNGQGALSGVYVYDAAADSWETRSPLPGPRAFAGAAVANGRIYVIGGYDGKKALDTNQAYIPERDKPDEIPWVEQARLPKGRYSMGITSLADTIYLIGGKGDTAAIEYVSQEDDWRALDAPFAQAESNLALVPFDTFIYSLGGISSEKILAEVQAYKAIYSLSLPIIR